MVKKLVLTFGFLTGFTLFYGMNLPLGVNEQMRFDSTDEGSILQVPYVISPYDHLIRNVSEKEGNDWRLMSAIAYHESRFTPDAVSRRGACGLMQIMPSVASYFDIDRRQMLDPETNVWLANRILNRIDSMLRLPAGIAFEDRMSLVLASYNGGIGHVLDARRLARAHGEDPDSWEVVARYLRLKAEPEYYLSEAVQNGRFAGSGQTLAYVRDVMSRYDRYCRIADR